MNLGFTTSNPRNSDVFDSATGQHLYEFSTTGWWASTTTLWDQQGRLIWTYKSRFIHDEVTYGASGRTMRMSDWLVERKFPDSCRGRTFLAPNGRLYEWRWESVRSRGCNGILVQLFDCQTAQLIAKGHRNHKRWFTPSSKMNINVLPDGLPIVDTILFSLVPCELIRRREENAASSAASQQQQSSMQALQSANSASQAATTTN